MDRKRATKKSADTGITADTEEEISPADLLMGADEVEPLPGLTTAVPDDRIRHADQPIEEMAPNAMGQFVPMPVVMPAQSQRQRLVFLRTLLSSPEGPPGCGNRAVLSPGSAVRAGNRARRSGWLCRCDQRTPFGAAYLRHRNPGRRRLQPDGMGSPWLAGCRLRHGGAGNVGGGDRRTDSGLFPRARGRHADPDHEPVPGYPRPAVADLPVRLPAARPPSR